jgi:hypothetical protein
MLEKMAEVMAEAEVRAEKARKTLGQRAEE